MPCYLLVPRMLAQVILAPSTELVHLEHARCSVAKDTQVLREQLRGRERVVAESVAALIRSRVAGVTYDATLRSSAVETVDGVLGPLSLRADVVTIAERHKNSAAKSMHLARWLWSRPAVVTLDLSGCTALAEEVPHLLSFALSAGALIQLASLNLDGTPLPVKELSGAVPKASLDFSSKHLAVASGLVIAALIGSNASLTHLSCASNTLRDEGVYAIAVAIRDNRQSQLATLELQHTRFGVQSALALAEALTSTPSLTCLDISQNRLCGVYTDSYGSHGSYTAEGISAIAAALPASSITTLYVGYNSMRDDGAIAIARALGHSRSKLTTLMLDNNAIGTDGAVAMAKALRNTRRRTPAHAPSTTSSPIGEVHSPSREPASAQHDRGTIRTPMGLVTLDLSHNMICGVSTIQTASGPQRPSPYAVNGLRALADAVMESTSLTDVRLAGNRVCGVWTDAIGSQLFGAYDMEGVDCLADLLRSTAWCTLQHLDISANTLGAVGGKMIYDALRETTMSQLITLDLRGSKLDTLTEKHLGELGTRRKHLSILLS